MKRKPITQPSQQEKGRSLFVEMTFFLLGTTAYILALSKGGMPLGGHIFLLLVIVISGFNVFFSFMNRPVDLPVSSSDLAEINLSNGVRIVQKTIDGERGWFLEDEAFGARVEIQLSQDERPSKEVCEAYLRLSSDKETFTNNWMAFASIEAARLPRLALRIKGLQMVRLLFIDANTLDVTLSDRDSLTPNSYCSFDMEKSKFTNLTFDT